MTTVTLRAFVVAAFALLVVTTAAFAQGEVTNGANHAGSIGIPGEQDTWTVSLKLGDPLVIALAEPNGDVPAFVPMITLYGPDGTYMGQSNGYRAAHLERRATRAGVHRIVVSSADVAGLGTGPYQLTIAHMPVNFVVPAGDEGGAVSNGVNHKGVIHRGDIDQWRIQASAGESVVVGVAEPSGDIQGFVPHVQVYAPDGHFLTEADGYRAAHVEWRASQKGTYRVVVFSGDTPNEGAGDYQLTAAMTLASFKVPPGDQGGPLANGANYNGTIHRGDLDQWSLTAKAGEVILLSVGETGGDVAGFVPLVQLYGPDGAHLGQDWGYRAAFLSRTAPVTGAYRVVVVSGDTPYEGAGNYQITIAHPPEPFTVPGGDEGGALKNGAEHAGTIHLGDLDMWSFEAVTGAHVSIRVGETGGNRQEFVPAIGLYGPAGDYRGFDSGYTEATLNLTIQVAGRYTVVVLSDTVTHDGAGSYTLRATGIVVPPPPPLPQVSGRLLGLPCEPGVPCQCVPTYCGNPIDIASGNKFQTATDYRTAGSNVLEFTRYYNSLSVAGPQTFASALGVGWRSTFDRAIRIVSAASVAVERPSGRVLTFSASGAGWRSQSDIDLQLSQAGSQWTLIDGADTEETYVAVSATQAVLTSIRYRNGYTQTLHYDASNRLTAVADSFGRTLTLGYNASRLEALTTPDGTTTTFGYETSPGATAPDRLASVTDGTGATQTYEYEDPDLPVALTGIVDEKSNRFATWAYDGATGRAVLSEHAGGAERTTVSYDDAALTRTVTNALGQQEIYRFTLVQGVPRLSRVDRLATPTVAGASRVFTYDINGFLASRTDWNGIATTFVNDVRGLPTTIKEASGTSAARVTSIVYDALLHVPTQITQPGITTTLSYDEDGNLLNRTETDTAQQTAPYATAGQTRTWTMTWQDGLLTSIDGPRSDVADVERFAYDGNGTLVSSTNALGHVTRITQSTPGGRPLTIVDSNGATTSLTYDGRQRLIRASLGTTAGALVTSYNYDAAGNQTRTTLPDGSFTESSFDAAHRVVAVNDALGQAISYTLDALGDPAKLAIPAGGFSRLASFDTLGRLLKQTGAAGQETRTTYDSSGNALTTVDPLGQTTRRVFDALNRPTRVTDAIGGVTTTVYDAMGRPVRVQAPNGALTRYVYDGFGRRIQEISPDRGKTIYRYDPADNLVQRVNAGNVVINSTFDALNRVLSTTYPSAPSDNVAYRYDQAAHGFGIGRLTSLTDPAGRLDRSYDERGHVVEETRVSGAVTLRTRFVYDGAGHLLRVTYPSGTVVSYQRDAAGRVTDVLRGATNLASNLRYQPFGPLSVLTYGNGIVESRQFDTDYRLTGLTSAVQNLSYNYDLGDKVSSILDGFSVIDSQTFVYDGLDRLTGATGGYGSLSYTYDPNGNRLTQSANGVVSTYAYGSASNRLTQVREGAATQDFSYTPSGATSSIAATGQPKVGMLYSPSGRLLAVTNGSSTNAQYLYDAFGHRLVRSVAGGVSLFQYDQAGHLLAEVNAAGQTTVEYVYVGDRPLATIEPLTGKVSYLHTDHLGTPQVATDAGRAVVWKARYEPFGAAKVVTSLVAQNLRLPGQEFEASTGLHQNGFRDYMPGLGRYLESDPIGLSGGINLFAYARANPLEMIDPRGLEESNAGSVWTKDLPSCPVDLSCEDNQAWSQDPDWAVNKYHPGADTCYRLGTGNWGDNRLNQCCYDPSGRLITDGPGAGTPDKTGVHPFHYFYDVQPFERMGWKKYHEAGWAPIVPAGTPRNWGDYYGPFRPSDLAPRSASE
jgi:RHS repeat-associated protein